MAKVLSLPVKQLPWDAVIVLRDPSRSTTKILVSREGTTQGCPLAMLAYAIAILPLIRRLKNPTLHTQNWFSDDSACSGLLMNIRRWFDRLLTEGPSYGYFAEPLKSTLVVKEEHMEKAREMFANLDIDIVLTSRFLGGCIGNTKGIEEYVIDKVDDWVRIVSQLAEVAKSYLQSAHSAFTHSVSSQWTYLQRVMDGDGGEYAPLKNAIHQLLTSPLLGREVLGDEHTLFSLQAKLGGLAICDPTATGSPAYTTSRAATEVLQTAIKTGDAVCMADHE